MQLLRYVLHLEDNIGALNLRNMSILNKIATTIKMLLSCHRFFFFFLLSLWHKIMSSYNFTNTFMLEGEIRSLSVAALHIDNSDFSPFVIYTGDNSSASDQIS